MTKRTSKGMTRFLNHWAPPVGPPWPSEDFLRGSLLTVLGPRRVATRAQDGTNTNPGAAIRPRRAVWVGYEVVPHDGVVHMRAAMEQLITFVDVALADPVVRNNLSVHF